MSTSNGLSAILQAANQVENLNLSANLAGTTPAVSTAGTAPTNTASGIYNVTQNNPILRDSEYGQPFARYYAEMLSSSSCPLRQDCGKALTYLNNHIHKMYTKGKLKGVVYGPVGMYMATTTVYTSTVIQDAVREYPLLRFVIADSDDYAYLHRVFDQMDLDIDIDITAHHFPNPLVPMKPNSLGAVILAPLPIYNQIGHTGLGQMNQYFYDILFGQLSAVDASFRIKVLGRRFAVYPGAKPLAYVQIGDPVTLYKCCCTKSPEETTGEWFEPADFTISEISLHSGKFSAHLRYYMVHLILSVFLLFVRFR